MTPARLRPPAVYAIADCDRLERAGWALADAVEAMAAGGVEWIQVRGKNRPGGELARELERCRRRLDGLDVALWVDDRVDLAATVRIRGVHLGQQDLPPADARMLLGPDRWIGFSTHDRSQVAMAAADDAVDVVAVGPVFTTTGKSRPDPEVGLTLVREARRMTDKPLVAIGGIDEARIAPVLEAGADSVAMLGAICDGDVESNCRRLVAAAGGGV